MAKPKTKRRYYRRYYRRYKSVSTNYFRVKTEFNDRITFVSYEPLSQNAKNNGGYAFFKTRENQVGADQRRVVNLGDMLQQYAYTQVLQGLFSYYRPTGIRIEVVPEARNSTIDSTFFQVVGDQQVKWEIPYPQVMVSYRAGSNAAQNLTEVRSNNQSIVLNPSEKITRYWKIHGGTTAYAASSSSFAGAFTIQNAYPADNTEASANIRGLMVYQLQPSWSIKISVYYLYKYSKA